MTQKWEIDKAFNFCYGHRVHVQVLNTDYTERGHTCSKCRFLHGHEGLVKVFLEGDSLNSQSMVEDFVNLGWIKNFLDDYLDHKFILDLHDPWFVNIVNAKQNYDRGGELKSITSQQPLNTKNGNDLRAVPTIVPGTDFQVGYDLDVSQLKGPEREFFEGFFFVNFCPTSENLAKWLFDAVDAKMSLIDVKVSKISWNETPKSRAIYSR